MKPNNPITCLTGLNIIQQLQKIDCTETRAAWLRFCAARLAEQGHTVHIQWVPREENPVAHRVARIAAGKIAPSPAVASLRTSREIIRTERRRLRCYNVHDEIRTDGAIVQSGPVMC